MNPHHLLPCQVLVLMTSKEKKKVQIRMAGFTQDQFLT